ncbi:DNA polymerase IV [bacterium BMS3Bbin04]|nr:DNA polymerase IV [bacterium BMS3Bbin04]
MMRAEVRERLESASRKHSRGQFEPNHRNAKTVVHVDMDAFFAAIEERDNPSLRGKPVVVGGPKGSRGVITTANYIARSYGLHAGMSVTMADRLCPDAIHVSTKGGKYTWVSLELMEILRQFSPEVEPYSIDEAFLNATGCIHLYGSLKAYGEAIKRAVKRNLNLTASVGIGPSKVVAKIGSGLNKPDGLTIIESHEVASRLGPLPIKKIPGVGPATEKLLNALDIHTVQQLVDAPRSLLQMKLGKYGNDLALKMAGATGVDDVAIERHVEDKSKGHEHTFHADVHDKTRIHSQLLAQCERVCRRMRRDNYLGRRVTLKLRTHDFTTHSHQRVLKDWTDDPVEIYSVVRSLLDDVWREEDGIAVRLVGVSVAGLIRPGEPHGVQDDIFQIKRRTIRNDLFNAVDSLRDRFGENAVGLAAGFPTRRPAHSHIHS